MNPLWRNQFHNLHGQDRDGLNWRRSRVAVDAVGAVIGAATVVLNTLHAGRMPCAVEVAPAWRRRGIGSQLLAEMRALRPDPLRPLSAKLCGGDSAGGAFVGASGGGIYQRCPGVVVDAADSRVREWVAAQPRTRCTSLATVDADAVVAAFADLYEWTHRDWSPVTDTDELIAVSRREISEADPTLSVAAWFGEDLAALALAFPRDDGVDVVAETVEHDQPHGQQLVARAVSALLEALAMRDGGRAHVDGHITDPHLQPVLASIPHLLTNPVDLVEIG